MLGFELWTQYRDPMKIRGHQPGLKQNFLHTMKCCSLPKSGLTLPLLHKIFWHAGIIVDHEQGMKFALDIAKGMEYLHSLDQLIPRLYLKSTHIMVSVKWYPWVLWSYIVYLFSLATEMKINKWDNNHSGKHCLYFFWISSKTICKSSGDILP